MKKCFKCGKTKKLDEFYKHKKMADGHLNKCKQCTRKDVANSEINYDRTEKGVIRVIYKTQKSNSIKRGHKPPSYTKTELAEWLYKNGFKKLYSEWVSSGYKKSKKPSVDRINDFKGYCLNNIKLGTWKDNKDHQTKDILSGAGTSGRRCKPVEMVTQDDLVVATFHSYWAAVRSVGYSVEYQIKKGVKCRNGFYWRYRKPPVF